MKDNIKKKFMSSESSTSESKKNFLPYDKEKSYISLNSNESYIDTDISPNILKKINSHCVLF